MTGMNGCERQVLLLQFCSNDQSVKQGNKKTYSAAVAMRIELCNRFFFLFHRFFIYAFFITRTGTERERERERERITMGRGSSADRFNFTLQVYPPAVESTCQQGGNERLLF